MLFKEWEKNLRDNTTIHCYQWEPAIEIQPKGVIQLVHGSCEHVLRYQKFIMFLVKNGYIVIGEDHRGHGKTAKSPKELGFFEKKNGWTKIVDDLEEINYYIRTTWQHLPIIMFGHSMGSFMARDYAIKYGTNLIGLILCGTAHYKKSTLLFSKMIAKIDQIFKGAMAKDKFINRLSYQAFNKRFKNEGKTGTEWQTSDLEVQQAFLADPLAGQIFSTSAFKDMFTGLLRITRKKNIAKIPKALPIYLISGQDDPVGNYGKGVIKTAKIYQINHPNVTYQLYPNSRHEILNEKIKDVVANDILDFCNKIITNLSKGKTK